MKINEQFLTPNPFSRPTIELMGVKGVAIHWVANPGQSAQGVRDYFESLKTQDPGDDIADRFASTQFVVGIGGEIIQTMPRHEMAYHVGAKSYDPEALEKLGAYPNAWMLGIELCHPEPDGKFTLATLVSAECLCAWLLDHYKLTIYDLWRHYGVTGKRCPKWFVDRPDEWEAFVDRIRRRIA